MLANITNKTFRKVKNLFISQIVKLRVNTTLTLTTKFVLETFNKNFVLYYVNTENFIELKLIFLRSWKLDSVGFF